MRKKTIGTFYFKRTNYGNLVGEFTNNKSDIIITETASPNNPTLDYTGDYQSIWFDIQIHDALLTIKKVKNKYKLDWTELNNPSYEGEGILMDDVLIGYYMEK